MEHRITKLEEEMAQLKQSLLQIVDKMTEMSQKINDLHSKPEPDIFRLSLPKEVHKKGQPLTQTFINEEGIPENYFIIKNSFPTAEVFYIDAKGIEKKIPVYGDTIYLGGNKSLGISGQKFNINDLTLKYFPKV